MQAARRRRERVGYLLKDRIADVAELVDALRRVAAGGTVVDPALVDELLDAPRRDDPLAELTPREREVLALVAEGRTDRGIAEALWLSPKTVETHVRRSSASSTCRAAEREPPRARRARLPGLGSRA